jgi:hypothetical protein
MASASGSRYKQIADNAARTVSEERLRISFDYIDWDSEEFFLHGLLPKYYQKLFECISEIKRTREREITQQTHVSLSPKSIFNTTTAIRKGFPDAVVEKIKDKLFIQSRDEKAARNEAREITSRAFEISLSKNYGRVHGFIWNNTFHIVWFDPAHNLYPMKVGVKEQKVFAPVKCFGPEEVVRLLGVIEELQQENRELETLINSG